MSTTQMRYITTKMTLMFVLKTPSEGQNFVRCPQQYLIFETIKPFYFPYDEMVNFKLKRRPKMKY